MKFTRFIPLFLIFLAPGCIPNNRKQATRILAGYMPKPQIIKKETRQTPPIITVWVHGTRFFPGPVLKKFFYCHDGLNHYTSLDPSYRHHTLCQTLIDSDPIRFDSEYFYLFGWSGALSFKEREKAAKVLYAQLKATRVEYRKKYGVEPKIRLVAHSHGGNVCLLLEKVKSAIDLEFSIEELIMLATPVQTETKLCACAPLFKKVYSLYSHLDSLQIIDPQGLQTPKNGGPLFSQRRFDPHAKICQCAIKVDSRYLMHVEFIKGKFLCKLPFVLDALDHWQKEITLKGENWNSCERCLNVTIKNNSPQVDWQAL
ncbi:hypothetical protein BH09DEP1_BH09DEP1_6730 [soil metagenome]